MREYIETILGLEHLKQEQIKQLFHTLVKGELDPIEIAALLVALRAKGEHPDEIAGAAQALRESAAPFPRPDYALADSCGTGGDGSRTINISTAVALVAAEMGIPMAKHGNRSISSQCGSADVLEKLGVKIDVAPEIGRRCLDEVGICFLFAPQFHQGLRHAGPVRNTLKIRTIFNVLGPLVNPCLPEFQIVGVYHPDLCAPIAQTLGLLGAKSAMVVHGSGLDEIAIHDVTRAVYYKDGVIKELEISPEQAGLRRYPLDQIRGSGPDENAAVLTRLFKGDGDEAHMAAVALNAGALAFVCGKAADLSHGAGLALAAIGSGRCYERLARWAELTHGA
ncbi:MAG: anthranilate phosphoribosyltransferase [Myxococcota bacterium]|nr:anthranilate phosphoribosyltransferase [Myxococcota bacterium]